MNKTISPKLSFLQSVEGAEFAEIQSNRAFRAAVETALQQMMMAQQSHTRFDDDARSYVELQGAKRYVDILLNLATADSPRRPDTSGVLQCQPKPQSSPPQPKVRKPKAPPLPVMPRI